MAIILDQVEGSRILALSKLTKRIDGEYIKDSSDLQTKFIKEQFVIGDNASEDKLRLLNLSYILPYTISTKVSDYIGDPTSNIILDLDPAAISIINGGYSVFVCRLVEGKPVIDTVEAERYSKSSDGTEIILTYYTVAEANIVNSYVLVQSYFGGMVTNKLYQVLPSAIFNQVEGREVPLSHIDETKFLPESQNLGLKRNPIVVVHNRKLNGEKYGASEVGLVESLISSIEIQEMNIQDQFLKHLQAKLALPTTQLPVNEKGFIDIRKLEAIGMSNGDPAPFYLTNSNPLIKDSIEKIKTYLNQISAITSIPPEFLGLEAVGGAESGDAKTIRISSFLKKINKLRKKFAEAMYQMHLIFEEWRVSKETLGDYFVAWEEIFPVDKLQVATELTSALDAGLISKLRAIMKYQDLDEEDAKKELQIINTERVDPIPSLMQN